MTIPPPYRPLLDDRAMRTERQDEKPKRKPTPKRDQTTPKRDQPKPKPDRVSWQRAVEAKLSASEVAVLRKQLRKMNLVQLARVAQLDPEDAANQLRLELPALTTRRT